MANDRPPTLPPAPSPDSIASIVTEYESGVGGAADEAVMRAIEHPEAIRAIQALQSKGFNVNSCNGYYETALNTAIGIDDKLVSYLLSQGADPNYYYQGSSPLSNAAQTRDVSPSTLSELLAHGAKVENEPALNLAAAVGSFEKVKILLGHGMDPRALSLKGNPFGRRGLSKGNALHEAAGAHYAEASEQKTRSHEWDPEEQQQTIRLLLQHGVDRQSQDDQGRRPVDWVKAGPGYKEPKFKRLTKPGDEAFDEEKHLERLKELLRDSAAGAK